MKFRGNFNRGSAQTSHATWNFVCRVSFVYRVSRMFEVKLSLVCLKGLFYYILKMFEVKVRLIYLKGIFMV